MPSLRVRTRRLGLLLFAGLLAALVAAGPSFAQALDSAQQKCVNGLNQGGARVNKAQNKENARCWKLFQKGKESSAEGCWNADARGKVTKAAEKVFDQEPGLCGGVTAPPFAYTSAFIVVASGREQSLLFLEDLYGADPDTPASLGAGQKDVGKCQQEAIKGGLKLEESLLKAANKAKKTYLAGSKGVAPVSDGPTLAAMIASSLGSDAKLQKLGGKIQTKTEKRCGGLSGADLQAALPGCNVATTAELASCIEAAARCRGCQKLSLMDDLAIDCDGLDDGASNMSCTAVSPTGTPTPTGGLTTTVGPTPTP